MNRATYIASDDRLGKGFRGLWSRVRSVWSAGVGRGPANPWALISLLTIAGWLVDSVLAAFQMHRARGDDLSVHLYHFWYLPPLIGLALWLLRKRLRTLGARVAGRPTLDTLAHTLRPEVRTLALQILASDAMSALLALLRQRPGSSMTAYDMALTIRKDPDEVEGALAGLQAIGLVETQCACDLTFYRLTGSAELLGYLDELEAWRADWLSHADRLAEAAGARLGVSR